MHLPQGAAGGYGSGGGQPAAGGRWATSVMAAGAPGSSATYMGAAQPSTFVRAGTSLSFTQPTHGLANQYMEMGAVLTTASMDQPGYQGMRQQDMGQSMYLTGQTADAGGAAYPAASAGYPVAGPAAYAAAAGRPAEADLPSGCDASADVKASGATRAAQRGEHAPATEKGQREDECGDGPDQCGDQEQCGAENRPPRPENLFMGVDTRPLLPIALALSTTVGGLVMLVLQVPLLSRTLNLSDEALFAFFLALYGVTLASMGYTALADPGQLRSDQITSQGQHLMGAEAGSELPLPKRSHKSWQYKRPIRRYDHYCRWLTNVIGLNNHRPFFIMLVGLNAIGVVGVAVDSLLGVSLLQKGLWSDELILAMHLGYSIGLLALASPIFRIHAGLVARNEVAAEWKRNDYYVAKKSKRGENVPVNELSDEEFNSLFDASQFTYDPSKNPFDRGLSKNCFAFWCHARWSADELGEF